MSQFFASGGQSVGVSASASVLPMNIQDLFTLGWTGWISLQSKGLLRVFSNTSSKASILWCSAFFMVHFSYPYMTTGKTIALTIWTFVDIVISLLFCRGAHSEGLGPPPLLFNTLSRFVIARSKQASFNFMAAVTIYSDFGAQGEKICHCLYFFPFYLP